MDRLVASTREDCVTHAGHITGVVLLIVLILLLLTCAVGWARTLGRAHRAEGALAELRAASRS